jgi:hypothetical protein
MIQLQNFQFHWYIKSEYVFSSLIHFAPIGRCCRVGLDFAHWLPLYSTYSSQEWHPVLLSVDSATNAVCHLSLPQVDTWLMVSKEMLFLILSLMSTIWDAIVDALFSYNVWCGKLPFTTVEPGGVCRKGFSCNLHYSCHWGSLFILILRHINSVSLLAWIILPGISV